MSDTVDKRIVEMEFDNAKFKVGIAETLEAIKNLDSALLLKNGTDGLSDVAAAAKKVDFSDVIRGTDEVGDKISGLKGIAQTAFDGIQAIAGGFMKGAGIAGLLTSLPVIGKSISGGLSRAQKLANAKFTMEGLGVEWKDIYNDINNSVDGTAYGLDSAASAASSLVASGVQIGDQMETTLKSIAGLAAMTNSDYDSISSIMTTVAGQGKLMTMQLRQLEMRGFNAAASLRDYLSQIPEFAGITEGEIRDMVTKGEITFDIFADAMSQYAGQAEKANETFNGAVSNIGAALSRTTADFFEQVMGSEGIVPLLNDVRIGINALNSGTSGLMHYSWDKETGEITSMGVVIQGVLDILKEVHRALSDVFGIVEEDGKKVAKGAYFDAWKQTFEVLASIIEKFFAFFSNGTYDLVKTILNLTGILREVFRLVLTFASPIVEAFDNIFGTAFGEVMHTVSEGTNTIVDFLHSIQPTAQVLDMLRLAATALLIPLRLISDIVGGVLYTSFHLFAVAGKLVYDVVTSIFEILGIVPFGLISDFATDLNGFAHGGITGLFDAINNGLMAIEKADPVILKGVKTVISGIAIALGQLGEMLKPIGDLFNQAFGWVTRKFSSYGSGISKVFERSTSTAGNLSAKFKNFAEPISEALKTGFGTIGKDVKNFLDSVGITSFAHEIAGGIQSVLGDLGEFLTVDQAFADAGENASRASSKILEFTSGLKDLAVAARDNSIKGLSVAFGWIRDRAIEAYNVVAPIASAIGDTISRVWGAIVKSVTNSGIDWNGFVDFFKSVGGYLSELFSGGITPEKLLEFFGNVKGRFGELIDTVGPQFSDFMHNLGNAVAEQLDGPLGALIGFADGVITGFSALPGVLSNIPNALGAAFSNISGAVRNPIAALFGSEKAYADDGGGFSEGVQDIADTSFDFIVVLNKIVSVIKKPWDTIYNFFTQGLSAGMTSIADAITNGIASFPIENLKLFISEISGIALDAGLIYGLFAGSNLISQVSKTVENFRDLTYQAGLFMEALTGQVKAIGGAIQKDLKANAFLKRLAGIALIFIAIAGAIWIISTVPDPWPAFGVIAAAMVLVTAMAAFIAHIGKLNPAAIASVSTIMTAFGIAMISVAVACAILTKLAENQDAYMRGLGGLLILITFIGVVVGLLGHFSTEGYKAAAMMLAFSTALGILAGIVLFLGLLPFEVLCQGLESLGILVAALVIPLLFLAALDKQVTAASKALAGFGLAMILLAGALMIMQYVAGESIISSLVQLGLGLLVMAAVGKIIAAAKLPEELTKTAVSLVLVAAAMALLSVGMAALVNATGGDIGAAAGMMLVLSIALLALGYAIQLAGGGGTIKGAVGLLIGAAALSALMLVIWAMSQLPFDRVLYGMGMLALAIIGLGAVAKFVELIAFPLMLLDTTLLGLGGALMLIVGSFILFGLGLEMIAVGAPAAVDGIIQALDKFQAGIEGREEAFLNMCDTMGRGAARLVTGFLYEITRAIDEWLQTWVPDVTGMIDNMGRIFVDVVGQIGSMAWDAIQGIGNAVVEGTADIMGDAGREGVASTNAELQAAYDQYDWASGAGAIGEGAMDGAAEGVEDSSDKLTDTVSDAISEAGEKGGKEGGETAGEGFTEGMTENIDGEKINSELSEQLQAMGLDQTMIDSIAGGDFQSNFGDLGIDMSSAMSGGILQGAEENPIDPAQLMGGMNLTSAAFDQNATDTGKGIGTALNNGTVLSMQETSPIDASVSAQTEAIKKHGAEYEAAGKENGLSYNGGAAKSIRESDVNGAVAANITALEKGIEPAGTIGEGTGTAYGSRQSEAISALATVVATSARASIYNAATESDPGGAGHQSGTWFGEGNISGINAMASLVSGTTRSLIWNAASTADPGGAGWRYGNWFSEGGGSGINSASWRMTSAAKSAASSAASDSDPGGHGYDGGRWFAEGMASGMGDYVYKVTRAARDMVKEAKKAADDEADSASPSKEMIKRGKWFTEGYAIGIQKVGYLVTQAASGMVGDAMSTAEESVVLMNTIMDNLDWDARPTIRPVLDLDDVETGMSGLNSMMDVSPTIRAAGYAGRVFGNASSVDQSVQNGGNTVYVTLDYKAGTSPNQIVKELASELELLNLTKGS